MGNGTAQSTCNKKKKLHVVLTRKWGARQIPEELLKKSKKNKKNGDNMGMQFCRENMQN